MLRMPVIQRCDLGEPQAFGDSDYGGIDDAKREVYIGLRELGHLRMSWSSSSAM